MTCRPHQTKHNAPRAQYHHGVEAARAQLDPESIIEWISSPELSALIDRHAPAHRERHFPPRVTLAMFILQALSADGSLQQAVNQRALERIAAGTRPASTHTGAYCRARQRLPLELVRGLCTHLGAELQRRARPEWLWHDRPVKLIDGTGLSMPDTEANQACYPQPASQAPGVGFPQARMVGVTCLATGAVLSAALGRYSGKGQGELSLMRTVEPALESGDVVLADALYGSYFTIAGLQERGIDIVCERNGSRRSDFRRGERLGARDHVIEWSKPPACPEWMPREQYESAPRVLRVRECQVGGRVLITTLCSPRAVSKAALGELYKQRWNVELDLRNIKTAMSMDVLRGKRPETVDKEIWVHLLAYNLVRALMVQAASGVKARPRELSFKHALQLWLAWRMRGLGSSNKLELAELLVHIAARRVGARPGRREPRATKRRPKRTRWLKEPRAAARERLWKTGEVL